MQPTKFPLKALLMVGGALFLFGVIIIGLGAYALFGAVSAPKVAAKEFLETAIEGDIASAYANSSADFQEVTSADDLGLFFEGYPVLAENTGIHFTNISIDNNTAVVYGTIEGGGETGPITVNLVKEDGEWRVLNLSLEPEDVPQD